MSRKKKFQVNWYQVNDSEAMAAKLEKMAAKGWLLEKASNFGWAYRLGEPDRVKYTITYFPDASVFDGGPTEGQETYADYCRAAGWEFVSAYGPIQYFRSTRPNPVPIETDEREKLRATHKTMLKTMVFSYVLLLAATGLQLPAQLRSFRYLPLSTVSSNRSLALILLLVLLALYSAAILIDYFVWYFRSKRSVERGGACAKVHTRARLWAGYTLLFACALLLLTALLEISSPGMAVIWLYAFGGMALLLALSMGAIAALKRRGCSRRTVRIGFTVSVVVLAVAHSAGIFPLINWLNGSDLMESRKPAYTYRTSYAGEVGIYQDPLPLTLENLGFTAAQDDHCSYEAEGSRSVLAGYTAYSQQPYNAASSLPQLRYKVAVIPWRWLRELCLNSLLEGYRTYRQLDGSHWRAERVYGREYTSGIGEYLLLYSDRILVVDAGWELTEEQMEIIAERLTQ